VWAPNSQRVVLNDVLMPIGKIGTTKTDGKTSKRAPIVVDISNGSVVEMNDGCKWALDWKGETVTCSPEPSASAKAVNFLSNLDKLTHGGDKTRCAAPDVVQYISTRGGWAAAGGAQRRQMSVFVKEAQNVPPKLFYQKQGGRARLLWDLNPQLKHVRLAQEKVITWDWSKGHTISAGLYVPPGYRRGVRYPLVIQTHTFLKDMFDYFGGFPTGNAAQPLAAHGMFVLQVNDTEEGLFEESPLWQLHEVRRAMLIYKSAIKYLSDKGLIDPKRVGIIGFSHTCFFVDWALTHSPSLFAAASVTEGGDGSFLEYMVTAVSDVEVNHLYTGPPFGRHLQSWVRLSPVFHLDRVTAPLLIGVDHNAYAFEEWEWLGGLRHLNKPVYMVVLDGRSDDAHLLFKPWDRLISSGDSVNWFDFWLNGHENKDPTMRKEYDDWRRLRKLAGSATSYVAPSWSSIE